ncbi:MAG TPA: YifB family Mg chelatase-like AAA ATPase [Mycobacteriales bacterium]|nr:YifB family Mg chelatase-like AAA ATPase [Mycobacteriales bacterium]
MSLARSWSVALVGVSGHLVEVEAHLATGLPGMHLIGLPDTALAEARDRVRAAIVNSGEAWPQARMTVGLSPATLRKSGSAYDLAVAVAILAAAGVVPVLSLAGLVLLGELGLDGRVRPVRGVLPAVLAASRAGVERVVVPASNAAEAALVPGVRVTGVRHLGALLRWLRGEPCVGDEVLDDPPPAAASLEADPLDLRDVLGQSVARRALEVAAAGAHHLFLLGPPGAGKTMLVDRLPGLLPPLDQESALEVTAVHSVAGVLAADAALLTRPPYRRPHHSSTLPALLGGGSGVPRPGDVSLAHRGVLFIDEAPEFSGRLLDGLRQPLESGQITISRADGSATYPARFLLALAANPCQCVRATGEPSGCHCSPLARRRYLGKLSGPLLDRVDIQVQVFALGRGAYLDVDNVEGTAAVAARVAAARATSAARLAGTPWRVSSDVPGSELRLRWPIAPRLLRSLDDQHSGGRISARGRDRVHRLAWTIADLSGHGSPTADDVDEAMLLRGASSAVAA